MTKNLSTLWLVAAVYGFSAREAAAQTDTRTTAPAITQEPTPPITHANAPRSGETPVSASHAKSSLPQDTTPEPARLPDGSYGAFQRHAFVSAALRSSLVGSRGFDPYSANDAMTYFSVTAGRVVFVQGEWSLAAGLGLDVGTHRDTARGSEATLSVLRFSLSPELRYHLFKRSYAYGRLGAGVARVASSLDDQVTSSSREHNRAAFTAEIGAGLAYAVASSRSMHTRSPRLWLLLEGGVLYFPTLSQRLTNSSSVPARSNEVVFPDLSLLGPYARAGLALSF